MNCYADDALLTPRQAAEYLGVHINTLQVWRQQGRGPSYVNFGIEGSKRPHYMYPYSFIKEWVESRTISVSDDLPEEFGKKNAE